MQRIEFFSFEQQDEFVLNLFNNKQNGFFLDISCGHPTLGSNSCTLERYNNWNGLCFDIYDYEANFQWSTQRTSPLYLMDVTKPEFATFLKNTIPQDLVVDYISLDVDGATGNLALTVLERILESGIKFKAMTFEHEYQLWYDEIRAPSRAMLEQLGYIRLFEDVKLWTCGMRTNDSEMFEDWWIHPQYFDPKLLPAQRTAEYYWQCIEALRNTTNIDYQAHHHCCRAFPAEYDLFWNDQDRENLTKQFPFWTK